MKTLKKAGICMDHANAHIIEFSDVISATTTVSSDFSVRDKEEAMQRGEKEMHNKEQHKILAYYKKLVHIISGYDELVLFGPTDAKSELFNFLRKLHLYDKIRIDVRNTDKMTDNQQHAFVRKFFKPLQFKAL